VCSYHFVCCLDAPLLFYGLYLKGIWIFAFSALDRILPVVSRGYETWSLKLKEEHRLMVFENRVQRMIHLAYMQILFSPLVTAAVAPLVIGVTESFHVCFKVTILGWWRLYKLSRPRFEIAVSRIEICRFKEGLPLE